MTAEQSHRSEVVPKIHAEITASDLQPLWRPSAPQSSSTFRFLERVNGKYGLTLASYFDLYKWSTAEIGDFWSTVWDETGIVGVKGAHVVDRDAVPAANPAWFADAEVNWAENMLQCRSPDKVALVHAGERKSRPGVPRTQYPCPVEPLGDKVTPELRRITYAELYSLVADLVSALLDLGLQPGDRVASYSSNCIVRQF